MTGAPESPAARLLHVLRGHAARSGPFRPADAVRAAGPEATADPLSLAEALSKLHSECTVTPGPAGEMWLYRPEMRRKMQAAASPDLPTDAAPDAAIAQAQAGRGDFAPQALDRVIATSGDPDRLAELAVALERAGPRAPGHDRLVRLRSALNAARERSRGDALLAQGFFGRADELAALADWIGRPGTGLPLRAMLVSGGPGIGKTLLLERAVQSARETARPVLIRLDFERPALGTGEDGALFEEISRQVADSLPAAAAEMRALRLAAAEERVRVERGSGRRYLPRDLLAGIVRVVRDSARPVLVLLDTLDVLQGRGLTYPDALMASFDRMVEAGMTDMRIVAAGRGPVFLDRGLRVARQLDLTGLDGAQARRMLAARGVPRVQWPGIVDGARGNPLLLALAADEVIREGAGADPPKGITAPVATAWLHRAILGRLPEDLREPTLASLLLPVIDAGGIEGIILPALGQVPADGAAERLLAGLAEQVWLVDRIAEGLVLRGGLREEVSALIRTARPEMAARVERRVAAGQGPGLPADQPGGSRQRPTGGAAQLDRPVGARRGAARQARSPGGLWVRLDAGRDRIVVLDTVPPIGAPPDAGVLATLADRLVAGSVEEAAHLMAQHLTGPVAADSAAGRLVLALCWLSGQWAQARRLFLAQPDRALDEALAESPQLLGRVLVEAWAEFRFARLRARLRDPVFRALAAQSLTGAGRIALRGGALDFAVISAAGEAAPPAGAEEGQDALAGRMHGVPPARVAAARAAAETLRAGFGLGFSGSDAALMPEPPWEAGARIAPLNPYDGPLRALVSVQDRRGGSALTRRLAGLAPVLPEIARLLAPGVDGAGGLAGRVTAHAPDLVEALGAMGLTAEWSGAMAAGARQPDLRLIARAAERWRRTVCGVWSYPSDPPAGWTGIPLPDWGSRHLADAFAADGDPAGRARRALAIWSDPSALRPDPGLRAPLPAGPPEAVLADLLRRGRPVSVAVPLAILSAVPPRAPDSPAVSTRGDR